MRIPQASWMAFAMAGIADAAALLQPPWRRTVRRGSLLSTMYDSRSGVSSEVGIR